MGLALFGLLHGNSVGFVWESHVENARVMRDLSEASQRTLPMLACGALAMIAAELGALGGMNFGAVSAVDVVDIVEANFGRETRQFGELSEYSSG